MRSSGLCPSTLGGEAPGKVLLDRLDHYGAGIRTPELVLALAPVIRSQSRNVLIIIHEAEQFLRPGPHYLRHEGASAASQGVHLLVIEHDRAEGDWILVNAIAAVALRLDQLHPASGIHATPLLIQSSGGICDLYAIASTVRFGTQLHAFVEAVQRSGEEPSMTGKVLDSFADTVLDFVETASGRTLAVARLNYRIEV